MAILTKGIFGPVTGRLGNLVFCICANGTNYVRTVPNKTKVKPSKAQIAQREKFRMATQFLNPIKELVKRGFPLRSLKKRATPMSVAMSMMLRTGIVGEYPDFRIDFPKVQLSLGNLQLLSGIEIKSISRRMMVMSWCSLVNSFTSFAEDKVQLIVYNATQGTFVIEDAGCREDEAVIIKLKGANPMDHLVFYAFTETKAGGACAQYVGEWDLD